MTAFALIPRPPSGYRRRTLVVPAVGLAAVATAACGGESGGALGGGLPTAGATRFLLAISVVLMAANVSGKLFERLRQPPVMGELVCGILLGNLALGGIATFELLKTEPFLAIVAEVGVILLLFQVGLESSLGELLAVGRSSVGVAVLGVAAPIGLGYLASTVFLPNDALWYVHLFVGATLAATSVGITARVLRDIGKMDSPESKVILGAAVVDDILGLVVLALLLGLVHSADAGSAAELSWLPVLAIVGKAVSFLAGSFFAGRVIIARLIKRLHRGGSQPISITHSVVYCFLMSAAAELVGLAAIVGAFAAGLIVHDGIARSFGERKEYKLDDSIAPISALFVPVFFVYVGLRVDLSSFASPDVLLFAGALSVVAVASKQICSLGVLEKGLNRWAVGIGMIPRGEVGLIFAGIGAAATVNGETILNAPTFSALVLMVLITMLATPPLLNAVFRQRSGAGPEPA